MRREHKKHVERHSLWQLFLSLSFLLRSLSCLPSFGLLCKRSKMCVFSTSFFCCPHSHQCLFLSTVVFQFPLSLPFYLSFPVAYGVCCLIIFSLPFIHSFSRHHQHVQTHVSLYLPFIIMKISRRRESYACVGERKIWRNVKRERERCLYLWPKSKCVLFLFQLL